MTLGVFHLDTRSHICYTLYTCNRPMFLFGSQSAFCGYTVSPVKDENKCGLIYYLTYPVSYMTFFSKYLFQVTPSPTLATGATFCKALLCSSAKRGGGNISLTIFISTYILNLILFHLQYISSASTAALMCKKGGR